MQRYLRKSQRGGIHGSTCSTCCPEPKRVSRLVAERSALTEQEALLWEDCNQTLFFEEQDWTEMELEMVAADVEHARRSARALAADDDAWKFMHL